MGSDQPKPKEGAALDQSVNGGAHLGSGIASINDGISIGSSVAGVVNDGHAARADASNQAPAPNAQATQAAPQARPTSRGRRPAATSSSSTKPLKATVVKGSSQRERDDRSLSPSDENPRHQCGIHSRRGETRRARDEDEHDRYGPSIVNNYTFNLSLQPGFDKDALADAVRASVEAAHAAESGSTRRASTQARGANEVDENAKESDKAPTTQGQAGESSGHSTMSVAADEPKDTQAVPPAMDGTSVPVGSGLATPADGAADDAGDGSDASDGEADDQADASDREDEAGDDDDSESVDYDVMDTSDDTGVAVVQPSTAAPQVVQQPVQPALFKVTTHVGGVPELSFSIDVKEIEIPLSRHGVGLFSRVVDTITGDDDYQRVSKDFGIHCGLAKVQSFEVNVGVDGGFEAFICDTDWSTHNTLQRLRWYTRLNVIESQINIIVDMLV